MLPLRSTLLGLLILKLSHGETPDSVSISPLNHTGPMVEGTDYQLLCDIQNVAPVKYLTVRWYKGNENIYNETFYDLIKTPKDLSPSLNITPSRDDNGAQYRCVAELDLGPEGPQPPPIVTSASINITVHYTPEFICTDRYNCTENENHKLACTADGNPEPKITWSKDGKEVHFPGRPTREDSGEYIIFATNKHGRANHTLHIDIWYGPEFQLGGDTVTVVAAGSDVTLNCSADGNPPPKPMWAHNTGEHLTVATEGRHSTLYVIGAATNATYNCTATNRLGTIHKLITVLVEAPMTSATSMTSTSMTTLTTAVPKVFVLELHPPKVVVSYGDSVSVNCSTPSIGHGGMGWEATYGATDLKENCNFVTWTVDNLTDWTIVPECYINIGDKQPTKPLLVVLYNTPDSVSISPLNHTGPMVEGTDYQLLCDIQNVAPVKYLTVRWYKGNENIYNETFYDLRKTPVNLSPSLNITPSRDDNGAQYRCVAELDLGPEGPQPPPIVTSASINITVHYEPLIKDCPRQFADVESRLNLHMVPCRAEGNPHPNATWYREGRQVDASVPLTRRDSGKYVFTVTNDLGSNNSTIDITVEYTPEFICTDRYNCTEKENHKLACTADGNPEPKITWSKDGKEVHFPGRPTREDSGEYIIFATNKHGRANHTLHIDIWYGPEFQLGGDTVTVVAAGSDVTLNCSAEGNPTPELKWTYADTAQNVNLTTKGRQRTLRIIKATSTNAGNYICTATNKVGKATRYFTVTVTDYTITIIVISMLLLVLLFFVLLLLLRYHRNRKGNYECNPLPSNSIELQPLQ